MKKFKVGFKRRIEIVEETFIIVDAKDSLLASIFAKTRIEAGEGEWKELSRFNGSCMVNSVDEDFTIVLLND